MHGTKTCGTIWPAVGRQFWTIKVRAALLNGKHTTACERKLPFYSNMHIRSYFIRLLLCCMFTVTWVVLELRRNNEANDFKMYYFAVFTIHQKTLLHAKFQMVKISFSYFISVCMNARDIVLIYILYLMNLYRDCLSFNALHEYLNLILVHLNQQLTGEKIRHFKS